MPAPPGFIADAPSGSVPPGFEPDETAVGEFAKKQLSRATGTIRPRSILSGPLTGIFGRRQAEIIRQYPGGRTLARGEEGDVYDIPSQTAPAPYERYRVEPGTRPEAPLQQQAVGTGERTFLKAFAERGGPRVMAAELQKRGYEVADTGTGEIAVRAKPTDPWGVVEPRGFAKGGFGEFGKDVLLDPLTDYLKIGTEAFAAVPTYVAASGAGMSPLTGIAGAGGAAGAAGAGMEAIIGGVGRRLGVQTTPEEETAAIKSEFLAGSLGEIGGAAGVGALRAGIRRVPGALRRFTGATEAIPEPSPSVPIRAHEPGPSVPIEAPPPPPPPGPPPGPPPTEPPMPPPPAYLARQLEAPTGRYGKEPIDFGAEPIPGLEEARAAHAEAMRRARERPTYEELAPEGQRPLKETLPPELWNMVVTERGYLSGMGGAPDVPPALVARATDPASGVEFSVAKAPEMGIREWLVWSRKAGAEEWKPVMEAPASKTEAQAIGAMMRHMGLPEAPPVKGVPRGIPGLGTGTTKSAEREAARKVLESWVPPPEWTYTKARESIKKLEGFHKKPKAKPAHIPRKPEFTPGHERGLEAAEHVQRVTGEVPPASPKGPVEVRDVQGPLELRGLIRAEKGKPFDVVTFKNDGSIREIYKATIKPPPEGVHQFTEPRGAREGVKQTHNLETLWLLDDAGNYIPAAPRVLKETGEEIPQAEVRALHLDEVAELRLKSGIVRYRPPAKKPAPAAEAPRPAPPRGRAPLPREPIGGAEVPGFPRMLPTPEEELEEMAKQRARPAEYEMPEAEPTERYRQMRPGFPGEPGRAPPGEFRFPEAEEGPEPVRRPSPRKKPSERERRAQLEAGRRIPGEPSGPAPRAEEPAPFRGARPLEPREYIPGERRIRRPSEIEPAAPYRTEAEAQEELDRLLGRAPRAEYELPAATFPEPRRGAGRRPPPAGMARRAEELEAGRPAEEQGLALREMALRSAAQRARGRRSPAYRLGQALEAVGSVLELPRRAVDKAVDVVLGEDAPRWVRGAATVGGISRVFRGGAQVATMAAIPGVAAKGLKSAAAALKRVATDPEAAIRLQRGAKAALERLEGRGEAAFRAALYLLTRSPEWKEYSRGRRAR